MSACIANYNHAFALKWVRDLSPISWRGKVNIEFREVSFALLEHAGCWTDPDVVDGWRRTIEMGKPIPPPVATLTERGTYYLHDGNHRYKALRHCLGDDPNAGIRIAVAVPRPGYRFVCRDMGGYATYVLEDSVRPMAYVRSLSVPLLASIMSLVLTATVPGVDEHPFFVFFVLSVVVSAWFAGRMGGILATLLNSVGAAYFMLPPTRSLLIASREHVLQFILAALAMFVAALFMNFVRSRPGRGEPQP